MVSSNKKVAVVAPGHGANGRVVGLQDRLEIESNSIPQGKLAGRSARQDSLCIWCPLHNAG